MGKGRYLLKRFIYIVFVFFIISILMFFIYKLMPGDPVTMMLGDVKGNMRPDQYEQLYARTKESLGLNGSLVEQYIRAHYEEPLSLDLLAEKVYLTPHYLSSIFIQEKGIGINKYIKNLRMEKARELLTGTNMKISEICERVGYSNLSYFCRTFRNEFGMTPEQYRR